MRARVTFNDERTRTTPRSTATSSRKLPNGLSTTRAGGATPIASRQPAGSR